MDEREKVVVVGDVISVAYKAKFTVSHDDIILMDDLMRDGNGGILIRWIKAIRADRPGLGLRAAKDVADYVHEELMYGGIKVDRSPKVIYDKVHVDTTGFDSMFDTALNA